MCNYFHPIQRTALAATGAALVTVGIVVAWRHHLAAKRAAVDEEAENVLTKPEDLEVSSSEVDQRRRIESEDIEVSRVFGSLIYCALMKISGRNINVHGMLSQASH